MISMAFVCLADSRPYIHCYGGRLEPGGSAVFAMETLIRPPRQNYSPLIFHRAISAQKAHQAAASSYRNAAKPALVRCRHPILTALALQNSVPMPPQAYTTIKAPRL